MSNAIQRILTALIGAPLLIGVLWLGGWPFAGLVLVIALVAQHELYTFFEAAGVATMRAAGLLAGGLLVIAPLWPPAAALALAIALALVAWSPFAPGDQPLFSLGGTLFGAIYPSGLLAFLVALRRGRGPEVDDTAAFLLTLTVFLLIWATDILAYVVGKNLGRRPLAPAVSPKKTWEGSLGGALGAVLVAAVLKLTLLPFLAWPHVVALALICGVFSQLGDLAESRMKRSVGVKDSGTILPGHGGLLDRFDALILAAPAVYLYLVYVARVMD